MARTGRKPSKTKAEPERRKRRKPGASRAVPAAVVRRPAKRKASVPRRKAAPKRAPKKKAPVKRAAAPKKKRAPVKRTPKKKPSVKRTAAPKKKRAPKKRAPVKRAAAPKKKRAPAKRAPKKKPSVKRAAAPKKKRAPVKRTPKKKPPVKRAAPKKRAPVKRATPPKKRAPRKAPVREARPTPKKTLKLPEGRGGLQGIESIVTELRKARGRAREVLLTNLQHAADEHLGGLRQARAEAVLAPRRIAEWRRDLNKALPSRFVVALFEEMGEWRQNPDGTRTGVVQFEVPGSAGSNAAKWRRWMLGWGERHLWLDNEVMWFAIGLSVGGVSRELRDRYVRIKGRVAIMSNWVRSRALCEEQGRVCAGVPPLYFRFQEYVGPLLINEKGYVIDRLTLFAHFGPVKPRGDIR